MKATQAVLINLASYKLSHKSIFVAVVFLKTFRTGFSWKHVEVTLAVLINPAYYKFFFVTLLFLLIKMSVNIY